MSSEQSHAYIQEYAIAAPPAFVWELLCSPSMWGASDTVTIRHTKHPGTLTSGSSWQESHHGALFLREWVTATIAQHCDDQMKLLLQLDDGHNHIQQQLRVVEDGPGACRIITSLACYQRRAATSPPVPSDKLALMWRKADKRLASFVGRVAAAAAAATAAAAADAPAAIQHAPLVPV